MHYVWLANTETHKEPIKRNRWEQNIHSPLIVIFEGILFVDVVFSG